MKWILRSWGIFGLVVTITMTMTAPRSAAYEDKLTDQQRIARNKAAIQTIYRDGVPHTDRHGVPRMTYDPKKSFFPIGSWGVPASSEIYDIDYDWSILARAGFNTVWPHHKVDFAQALAEADKNQLRMIWMYELSDEQLAFVNDGKRLLGNVWFDEPIGHLEQAGEMDRLFGEYTAYRQRAHAIAPWLNIFINDAPWITPPATDWWIKWNTSGEVSCHDNYPIMHKAHITDSVSEEPSGIAQSVSLAVKANREQKPVWFITGAFDGRGSPNEMFPFRFPSVMQLRSTVYAAIINGATGVHYFIWDSWISRNAKLVGISPDPKESLGDGLALANPLQLAQSKALWMAAEQINKELAELTPVILSPTVGPEVGYRVHITGPSTTKTPLKCILKPHPDGGYVLLTVNMDEAVLETTYTFPKPLASVEAMFENHTYLPFVPGSETFDLHYEPYEVHVLRIIPE